MSKAHLTTKFNMRFFFSVALAVLSQYNMILLSQQCSQPVRFTWEGAVNGNKAVWNVNDTENTYPNVGGIDVNVKLLDPHLKNTNTSNPSDYGDYTKTNTFYGRGNLAFQITSTQSNQPVCLQFTFSKPIFLHKFEVFDIDYIGSGSNPLNTFQDSVSFFAVNDSGAVALQLSYLKIPPAYTISGQSAHANYIYGNNGDLAHTDSTGGVRIHANLPLSRFTLCNANGHKDMDGLSNSQAIKIMPFEFCEASGRISGRVTEYLTNMPLAGSVLTLVDLDGNVVKDKNGFDFIFTTGPDGYYEFTDVPFGKYKIKQVNPPGYDSENDVDGVNDEEISVNLHVNAPFSTGNDFYEKISSPLPVRFGGMSLHRTQRDKVNVSWKTLGEQNSDFFLVQVSDNGQSFRTVSQTKAKGNIMSETLYSEDIVTPSTEKLYVRLIQYDLDGRNYLLDIQYLRPEQGKQAGLFRLYPNPVSETLNIEAAVGSEYRILDVKGNVLLQGVLQDQSVQLSVGNLQSGTYIFRLSDGIEICSGRFLILK